MEMATYLRFVAALVFVLALIGVVAWLVRRFGLAGARPLPRGNRKNRRLVVVEMLPIDARRRAVLLRRDRVEHLVLLGPTSDLLLESVPLPPFESEVAAASAGGQEGEPE